MDVYEFLIMSFDDGFYDSDAFGKRREVLCCFRESLFNHDCQPANGRVYLYIHFIARD